MKFKFGSFLAGILCAALIGGLTVSALAITGKTTIEVYPINVMVNGEVFQPTDAQGNPVDIFTYNGTTYAPLRALATAYGLEVGYDAEKKLATVTDPALKKPEAPTTPDYSDWSAEDEAAYQEFKGMLNVEYSEQPLYANGDPIINVRPKDGKLAIDFVNNHTDDFVKQCCYKLDCELLKQYGKATILYYIERKGWGWSDHWFEDGWECGYKQYG